MKLPIQILCALSLMLPSIAALAEDGKTSARPVTTITRTPQEPPKPLEAGEYTLAVIDDRAEGGAETYPWISTVLIKRDDTGKLVLSFPQSYEPERTYEVLSDKQNGVLFQIIQASDTPISVTIYSMRGDGARFQGRFIRTGTGGGGVWGQGRVALYKK